MPLGQRNGYTLSLLVDLPEPALKIASGVIEKAQTSTGKSLLPQHSWQWNIRFFKLSTDGTAALFDVDLALPDYNVKSIEELSGQLEYVTGSGGRQVDLGMMTLKAGAKGQALNAVVSSAEQDPYGNNESTVRLRLDLPPESLKSVAISGSGSPVPVSIAGRSGIGNATTFKLAVPGKLPTQGRIVLTVYEQFEKTAVPFKLTRISLTGEPVE